MLAYDHNWDNTAYPIQVLNDPAANQYVAGTAFHAYAGSVGAQNVVHNAHPDKDIYFTEITGGDWATNFGDNLVWNFQNILIGSIRNWSKNALLWNLALNQNDGPHQNGCDGLPRRRHDQHGQRRRHVQRRVLCSRPGDEGRPAERRPHLRHDVRRRNRHGRVPEPRRLSSAGRAESEFVGSHDSRREQRQELQLPDSRQVGGHLPVERKRRPISTTAASTTAAFNSAADRSMPGCPSATPLAT